MARAVRKSHDPLFKNLFGAPEHAAALVRHILPAPVLAHLDLAAMHPVRGSFVDDQLSERYTDLLFSLPTADGEILVYILIEHQSLDDVNMPLRVLEYLARIWVDYRRRHPNAPLPVIVPIILCHPPQGWQTARRLGEMFDGHPAALTPYIPDFELALLDLSTLSTAQLQAWTMDVGRKLGLWALRDVRAWERFLDELPNWHEQLEQAAATPAGLALLEIWFRYIMLVHPTCDLQTVRERIPGMSAAIERTIMSVGEKLIEEGRRRGLEEGRQEGRQEGLREGRVSLLLAMLAQRFGELGTRDVERLAHASLEQLDTWGRRLLAARSLDEVFE